MINRFDNIAPVYDFLARLTFGKKWKAVQAAPARELTGKQRVLIVGGGTGRLLECFSASQQVTYVEMSPKMLYKARKRRIRSAVDFVQADYLSWETTQKYNAIIFPFFLDCFRRATLPKILSKAQGQLMPKGELHVVDFQKAGRCQNFLVRLMYLAFRIIASLEGRNLPDLDGHVKMSGFTEISGISYAQGWIFYRIYRRIRVTSISMVL